VEILRRKKSAFTDEIWDWGIPTATALREVASLRRDRPNFNIIASGGISTGLDAAKCLALGADFVSSARPMLKALHDGGKKGLKAFIGQWATELRGVMFLTASPNIHALQRAAIVRDRYR
jgi:isopentenyl-diphosphate delta-isomerase